MTTFEFAMNLIMPLMKNGKGNKVIIEQALRENNATSLITLARKGYVIIVMDTVKTPERHYKDIEQYKKQVERKALKKQIAELEKQLKQI